MSSESLQAVRLDIFEGPLDLLLHLVRINAVDITDIPIVEITRQYQEYLDLMQEWNLEIAAEFLLMAATLIHIKSKVLLPSPPGIGDGADEEDPRDELMRQLIEHQQFREAVSRLREGEIAQQGTRFRAESIVAEFQDEFHLEVDLFDLVTAFRKILVDQEGAEELRVEPQPFPIEAAIRWLQERLPLRDRARLGKLFADLQTRYEKIAVFLALLELIRTRQVVAFQSDPGGDIFLIRREPETLTPAEAAPQSIETEETIG
jgi:segregation and condensation protein A